MAFYLVLSLGATSGLFFLAGADFVGAMQLMIYVGGTLVLLVFGVMLTAQSPFISMKTRAGNGSPAWSPAGCCSGVLLTAAFNVAEWRAAGRSAGPATTSGEGTAAAWKRRSRPRAGPGLVGARVDKLEDADPQALPADCRAICCRSKSCRSICWWC